MVGVVAGAQGSAWALGFGAAVGHMEQHSGAAANSRGVFGRLNLLGPLDGELHVSRVDYDGSDRSDRQIGVALHLDIIPIGKWMPYLFAGTGVIDVSTTAWNGQLVYDEYGGGVAYRLNPRFELEFDYREGTLAPVKTQQSTTLQVVPENSKDKYQQFQVGLALHF